MLTKTGEFIQKFKSIRDAEIYVGCKPDSGGIIKVCKGKQKTAYGYIWRYENEVDKFVGGFKK